MKHYRDCKTTIVNTVHIGGYRIVVHRTDWSLSVFRDNSLPLVNI